jgi:ferredoxin
MTAHIRFEPADADGLVAHGTTLAEAAERLGVRLELACGGHGECDTCAVLITEGAPGLSSVTDAERRVLSDERLAAGARLACQAHLGEADCVVLVPEAAQAPEPPVDSPESEEVSGARERIRESFASLPPSERVAAAVEMQLQVAGDLLNAIVEAPLRLGEQFVNSIFGAPPPAPSEQDSQGGGADPGADSREEGPAGETPRSGDQSNEQF